ncbi:hypothetical protein ACOMHN_018776 [Nucella lapillus]
MWTAGSVVLESGPVMMDVRVTLERLDPPAEETWPGQRIPFRADVYTDKTIQINSFTVSFTCEGRLTFLDTTSSEKKRFAHVTTNLLASVSGVRFTESVVLVEPAKDPSGQMDPLRPSLTCQGSLRIPLVNMGDSWRYRDRRVAYQTESYLLATVLYQLCRDPPLSAVLGSLLPEEEEVWHHQYVLVRTRPTVEHLGKRQSMHQEATEPGKGDYHGPVFINMTVGDVLLVKGLEVSMVVTVINQSCLPIRDVLLTLQAQKLTFYERGPDGLLTPMHEATKNMVKATLTRILNKRSAWRHEVKGFVVPRHCLTNGSFEGSPFVGVKFCLQGQEVTVEVPVIVGGRYTAHTAFVHRHIPKYRIPPGDLECYC